MDKKKLKLSASRIKTLKTCSWIYWCNYILKLPNGGNDGSSKGAVVHLVLELLLKPKHRKHFNSIIKENHIYGSKVIKRLVIKHANRLRVGDENNLADINKMTMTALNLDFFCKGADRIVPEEEFTIETEDYKITGFIDKLAHYGKSKMTITDYKTSKRQFEGDDIDGNIQAFMYSLYVYKKYGVIPEVTFLFLKFPEAPEIKPKTCTQEELSGFESYLTYLKDYLANFDIYKATANYAADNPDMKWLCGFARTKGELKKDGSVKWQCPLKYETNYYALIDLKTEEVLKTSLKRKDLVEKEGTKVHFLRYFGCPKYGNKLTYKFKNTESKF